jgi:asparagine synthase (glutamine-hydrolysing)
MCGIAGLWDRRLASSAEALTGAVARMTASLQHRGPDDGGMWSDAGVGLALGFRRLSIIDLSPAGAQPMVSSCGRFVIIHNGEIYNADELRAELRALGRPFRGHSDTEVVLEGAASWGVAATVARLNGMFATALWDCRERRLFLIRDRLGIKPLYWAEFAGRTMFASELKAMRCLEDWPVELDLGSLTAYLRGRYVPGSGSIYRGVNKLTPGSILIVPIDGEPRIEPYWTLEDVARAGQAARFSGDDKAAVDQLDALLGDAVRRAMVSDVPLGVFLSGGIDSSTVTALMQASSSRPIRSFSIGFGEHDYDEAHHAAAVARHLGTDHTELYVSPQHALDLIPRLPEMYDEPLGNVAEIPMCLLSEMTRRHVNVALSGDGGDELFAGYRRYFQATDLWRRLQRVPVGLRRLGRAAIRALPAPAWTGLSRALPARLRPPHFGDKLYMLDRVLTGGPGDVYRLMISYWQQPAALLPGGHEEPDLAGDARIASLVPDFSERMQFMDTSTVLRDSILPKVDRASMAVGLEVRPALLDHRVVAFSWSLPAPMKIRGRASKWILRQVLDRYVPRELVERPKMGFDVPIGTWLRGPLRDWAEALLDEKRLRAEGVFDPAPIRACWREHLENRRNRGDALWIVLMFQAWKERWMG